MPKPVHYSPMTRTVIDGGIFFCDQHLCHEQLVPYETRSVKLDPVIDVDTEKIVGFGVYDDHDEFICDLDYVPKGEEDG